MENQKRKMPPAPEPAAVAVAADAARAADEVDGNGTANGVAVVDNYIDGAPSPPSTSQYLPVLDPSTSAQIGKVALSSSSDVSRAVDAARRAFPSWSRLTVKARAGLMLQFHALVRSRAKELAELIVKENGKNLTEALADVAKGNETVEYACSLPQLTQGHILDVSGGGVTCRDRRDPLGVVASVAPFNFPFMVPHWTLPLALVLGNTVVLKPSEKVPLTMWKVVKLFEEAGFPEGVVNLVNGRKEVVEALIDDERVNAVTFVGSSPIAKAVSDRCRERGKRCTALGGAKNVSVYSFRSLRRRSAFSAGERENGNFVESPLERNANVRVARKNGGSIRKAICENGRPNVRLRALGSSRRPVAACCRVRSEWSRSEFESLSACDAPFHGEERLRSCGSEPDARRLRNESHFRKHVAALRCPSFRRPAAVSAQFARRSPDGPMRSRAVRAAAEPRASAFCSASSRRCRRGIVLLEHLVALPDCDPESTSSDVVVSYAGCAGQRCMAASVLLIAGDPDGAAQKRLLEKVIAKAGKIRPGTGPGEMGPVIDGASLKKIEGYIAESEEGGAKVLLDGRSWTANMSSAGGNWIGPTILLHSSPSDAAMTDEIFGPVLSVHFVDSWAKAIEIENASPFGNAAAVYTTDGGSAEWFTRRFRTSMLGVNVGIPVPREPFSFGGLYGTRSKYGDMDITGDGAIEFFTNRIKVTSRWPAPSASEHAAGSEPRGENGAGGGGGGGVDHANFAGRM
ncbi:hypothetical protein ACHAWF_015854 [Thalassiosira exigua]